MYKLTDGKQLRTLKIQIDTNTKVQYKDVVFGKKCFQRTLINLESYANTAY